MKKKILLITAILFTATSYGQLTNGLLADYHFNDNTTSDHSGNNNHGTATAMTATQDRFGNDNMAYSFDGLTSHMVMPDGILLESAISISMWFKTSDYGVLIGHQTNPYFQASPQLVPVMYIGTDALIYAGFWAGTDVNANTSTALFNDGEWHHLVLMASSSMQDLYIDNVLVGSASGMQVVSGMVANQIGAGRTDFGWTAGNNEAMPFKGSIDDVRIYDRILTVNEINELYTMENPTASLEEGTALNVIVYPNPSSDVIRISASSSTGAEITSSNGSILANLELNGETTIDVSNYAPGVYFIRTEEGQTVKFIKE